jgi:hypothetical protein
MVLDGNPSPGGLAAPWVLVRWLALGSPLAIQSSIEEEIALSFFISCYQPGLSAHFSSLAVPWSSLDFSPFAASTSLPGIAAVGRM